MVMRSINYPPGPTNSRETLVSFARSPLDTLINLYQTYGDFVHYQLGPSHVYLINRLSLIRQVLVEMNDVVERTKLTHETLGKFIGPGLLVSAGDLHKRQRRTIQPAFTPAWIAGYAQLMVEATLEAIHHWRPGETRDVLDDMTTLSMQIVYRTIFGNNDSSADSAALDAIVTLQKYSGEALIRKSSISEDTVQQARDSLNRSVDALIMQRRQSRGKDFLSLLLDTRDTETGQPMSDEQARVEAINFFVAGQETSATALVWTWWLLALNPDAESALHAEIDSILGDALPTPEHLSQLHYTENVIKESMRVMPPVWLIGRRTTVPITLDGYEIDPEASIAISPYVLHRIPEYYPDPERFNPLRFEGELPRYSYLPFGTGPHVCIGQPFGMMEVALILTTIARRWRLKLVADQQIVPEPLITLRPINGIKVTLEARNA